MKVYNGKSRGWYEIHNAPIATRGYKDNPEICDDSWTFVDNGDAFVAIYPSADGSDTEEKTVDLSQGYGHLEELTLYEKVSFMRNYVSKGLLMDA